MQDKTLMYDVYQDFYKRVNTSKAFSQYCSSVYGIDLSQDGFCTKQQLGLMVKELKINQHDVCLDIGCGNGQIANYINKKTKALIKGIDYSENAIKCAREIKNSILSFEVQNINDMRIEKNRYSVIYLMDSIYFSTDYKKTVSQIYEVLINGGRIGIFYCESEFDKEKQLRKIEKDETKIAVLLNVLRIPYSVFDLSFENYKYMIRKNKIINNLKNRFEIEGNIALYERVNTESIKNDVAYEEFAKCMSRYLYIIEKCKSY
jgi:ubiquinone/menaquinone biosynthesis C-methylase UbiE